MKFLEEWSPGRRVVVIDPIIAGALITAAAGIGGGLFQSSAQQRITDQQLAAQREALQQGIRWRTEDARAAGLHPLFALGANIQAPSPMAFGDPLGPSIAQAGQDIGSAVSRMQTPSQRAKDVLELELLASQKGETDARKDLLVAEAAKIRQAGVGGIGTQMEGGSPVGIEGQVPNPSGVGVIDIEPAKVVSPKVAHPEAQAGQNPYYEEQLLAPDFPIMLPRTQGESAEEIISEMSPGAWLGLLLRNSKIYGEGWLEDLLRSRYLGQDPRHRFAPLGSKPPIGRRREMRMPLGVEAAIERALRLQGNRRRYRGRGR